MIQSIKIKNYALIEDAHIDLSNGLNIITGETGAGKSLFLSAISLILGEKADLKLIKNKEKETLVLIEINPLKHPKLKKFLIDNDLETDVFILKRRFTADSSRCFINDLPVGLNTVKELMKHLVYICSQNQNTQIADSSEQRNILDSFEENSFLIELKKIWDERKGIIEKINELENRSKTVDFNGDYISFQISEIENFNLSEDDLNIEEKIANIESQSEIGEIFQEMNVSILNGENSILNQIKLLKFYISRLNKLGKNIDENKVDLLKKDIQDLIESMNIEEIDLEEIQVLKNRVQTLKPILKKYGPTINDVFENLNKLKSKMNEIDNFDSIIKDLNSQLMKINKQASTICQKITNHRLKVIPKLEKRITQELQELNMKGSEFKIELIPNQELTQHGSDKIQFLIKPHAGQLPMPLAKIASGGELSRIMLALNSVIDTKGFFLFDEIDSGIGGNTGLSIGQKLKSMGQKNQIICITHLHQVAIYGNKHFQIEKKQSTNKTITQIFELNEENRVNEISRMLGDDLSSDKAMEHAQELLKKAQKK